MLTSIMSGRKIAAIYARVSTFKQKDGISLDQQTGEMLHYASSKEMEVPESYRFQEQVSGYSDVREYYDEIRDLIRDKKINALIVYTSDRYVRDPIVGDMFRAELRRAGVELHIVSEGGKVDIETPMGQFMRRMVDNSNWYWGMMIKQTMLEKKRGYTAVGIPYVSGFAKYGLERVGKKRDAYVVIVPDEAQVVQNMYEWFAEDGGTAGRVQAQLRGIPTPGDKVQNAKRKRGFGEWAISTIYSILRDPVYRGVYYADRSKIVETTTGKKVKVRTDEDAQTPINIQAIVSDELWYKVQQKLTDGRKVRNGERAKYQYMVSGYSICRHCGGSVTGNTGSNKIAYYRCNRRYMKANYVDSGCDFMPGRVSDVDNAVWQWIRNFLEHPNLIRQILTGARQRQQQAGESILEKIAEIDTLIEQHTAKMDMYANEIIEERVRAKTEGRAANEDVIASFKRQADGLAEHIQGLRERQSTYVAQLDEKVVSQQYIEDRVSYAEQLAGKLDSMTFDDKRKVIKQYGWTFEFEQKTDNPRTIVVHLQWLIWEYELTVDVTSPRQSRQQHAEQRHSPSESSLSGSHI